MGIFFVIIMVLYGGDLWLFNIITRMVLWCVGESGSFVTNVDINIV